MNKAIISYDGDGSNINIYTDNGAKLDRVYDLVDKRLEKMGYTDDEIEQFQADGAPELWHAQADVMSRFFEKNNVTHVVDTESDMGEEPVPVVDYLFVLYEYTGE